MKKLLTTILLLTGIAAFAQSKQLVKKAERATGNAEHMKALEYFNKALAEDPNSYRANAGKGILLSEFMEKHEEAIPFLEKAASLSSSEVLPMIRYNLGKSYHHTGDYQSALAYYQGLLEYGQVGNDEFQTQLDKQIKDCKYALEHQEKQNGQRVRNLGSAVNTSDPEYAPVFSPGKELIFTAKRKDSDKEKINKADGKYFESMYVSRYEDGYYTPARRFTQPDMQLRSKFSKRNESSISMSPDGKTLYIYKDGDIFEAKLHDSTNAPKKMHKNVNFGKYQNHVCLTPDGKSLYFSAESKDGIGGTDLYRCDREANGEWSTAVLLDTTINTRFNEDAPFVSEDGTLYFASNGHPGYGSYDIYKSQPSGGKWSRPVNMGQPMNSPAADIFFTMVDKDHGFFSSSRKGGKGDMDLYSVSLAPSDQDPVCPANADPLLAINHEKITDNEYTFNMSTASGNELAAVRYIWKVNENKVAEAKDLRYQFDAPGEYKVSAKLIFDCDTCMELSTVCNETVIRIDGEQLSAMTQNTSASANTASSLAVREISWENAPLYFETAKAELKDDAKSMLDRNIETLKAHPDMKILISGYADARGNEEFNKKLSLQRAQSVRQYLRSKGINNAQIRQVEGCGETGIINVCLEGVECHDELHQENRRVEIHIINPEYKPRQMSAVMK